MRPRRTLPAVMSLRVGRRAAAIVLGVALALAGGCAHAPGPPQLQPVQSPAAIYGFRSVWVAGFVVDGRTDIDVNERAVQKLTSELADFFGIEGRGRIAVGAAADLVVFDLETLDPGPLRRVRDLPGDEERLIADRPKGIDWVFVNGVAITENGRSLVGELKARPGRILRAGRAPAGAGVS